MPSEPFDEYIDQFFSTINPFGVAIRLRRSSPALSTPDNVIKDIDVGTLRMSAEHLKTMVFVLWRQVRTEERNRGAKIAVHPDILKQLAAVEDWEEFWKPLQDRSPFG